MAMCFIALGLEYFEENGFICSNFLKKIQDITDFSLSNEFEVVSNGSTNLLTEDSQL